MQHNEMEKYKAFVQAHTKGHFMQSPEWAKLKSFWTNEIITVEDKDGQIKGAMSVLIRKLPVIGYTMMYSPRGPVCDPHDKETLAALLEKAKILAKKHKSYALKMDPDIRIEDVEHENIMKSLGFTVTRGYKNYEGIQSRYVFRLDIKGKTKEEVMANFHHKTRYNIRVAERKGVEIRIGTKADVADFHNIIVETGVRDKFVVRSKEYYEQVLDCMGEHARIYMAYIDGKPIAGTIPILYGNKCWYLYGASSNEMRNYMPNYLLQWEMIKWGIESGCDIYDFRGIAGNLEKDNPLYGLYRFKVGFGGEVNEFLGVFDYVFNPTVNFMAEKGIATFRNTRRSLYNLKNRLKKTLKGDGNTSGSGDGIDNGDSDVDRKSNDNVSKSQEQPKEQKQPKQQEQQGSDE